MWRSCASSSTSPAGRALGTSGSAWPPCTPWRWPTATTRGGRPSPRCAAARTASPCSAPPTSSGGSTTRRPCPSGPSCPCVRPRPSGRAFRRPRPSRRTSRAASSGCGSTGLTTRRTADAISRTTSATPTTWPPDCTSRWPSRSGSTTGSWRWPRCCRPASTTCSARTRSGSSCTARCCGSTTAPAWSRPRPAPPRTSTSCAPSPWRSRRTRPGPRCSGGPRTGRGSRSGSSWPRTTGRRPPSGSRGATTSWAGGRSMRRGPSF